LNRRFLTCFRALLQDKEASTLTSSAYLLIAASIVFILCDKSIAAIALTFVAVGDPVAGMVRDLKGSHPFYLARGVRSKGLAGSCACLLACVVAGAILAAITHVALWLIAVGAVCATLIEFFFLPLNDNLTIPLAAGGVMSLVNML
jgi:dolichol kinase